MKRNKGVSKKKEKQTNSTSTILAVAVPSAIVVLLYVVYRIATSDPKDAYQFCEKNDLLTSSAPCPKFEKDDRYHILLVAHCHPVIVVEKNDKYCSIGLEEFPFQTLDGEIVKKVEIVSPDSMFHYWCRRGGTYYNYPLERSGHVVLRNQETTVTQADFLNKHYYEGREKGKHWFSKKNPNLNFSDFAPGCKYGEEGKSVNCGTFVATFLRLGKGDAAALGSKLENDGAIARVFRMMR